MYKTIPVYQIPLMDADGARERELWFESYEINMECKRAIEERAATAFNTRELDLLIEDLVKKFGVERALCVLTKSVQHNDWDERFDEIVRERAAAFDFRCDDGKLTEKTRDYITEIDPCVLDCIYLELMKKEIEESLKLKGEQLDLSYDNEYDEAFDGEECL